jgi:hypothetical protein
MIGTLSADCIVVNSITIVKFNFMLVQVGGVVVDINAFTIIISGSKIISSSIMIS